MKIKRILEGERYTSPAAGGLGFVCAYAEENGYEIAYAGTSMWLTDEALAGAMRQRMRDGLVIEVDGEEKSRPQPPVQYLVESTAAVVAREGIAEFIIPGCDADTAALWRETIRALTPEPAGTARVVPLNHEVVEVPSSEQIQAVLDRVDEIEAEKARPTRCPTCDSPSPEKHPAMQFEGEVQPCSDAWHQPTPADPKKALDSYRPEIMQAVANAERCPRCGNTKGRCPFNCATCHQCLKTISDGEPRVFTTLNRVYCLDCGKHA